MISPDESLARAVVYPNPFEGPSVSYARLIIFQGKPDSDGRWDESLYLTRDIAPEGIHQRGCALAIAQNEGRASRAKERGLELANPDPDRRIYCGYLSSAAEQLIIKGSDWEVWPELVPEDGDDYHVSLYFRTTANGASAISKSKAAAGVMVGRRLRDPVVHICESDRDLPGHPVRLVGSRALMPLNDEDDARTT